MAKHVWVRKRNDKVTIRIFRCKGCNRTIKCRNVTGFISESPEENAIKASYPENCPRPILSVKELRKLHQIIREWVDKVQPSGSESLYQVDKVTEAFPDLAEAICNIVGYHEDDIQ